MAALEIAVFKISETDRAEAKSPGVMPKRDAYMAGAAQEDQGME